MQMQPINLTIGKNESDKLVVRDGDLIIEEIDTSETIDFKKTIEYLLKDNFENEFAINLDQSRLTVIEEDARDFLAKVIVTYNNRVREWRQYQENPERETNND